MADDLFGPIKDLMQAQGVQDSNEAPEGTTPEMGLAKGDTVTQATVGPGGNPLLRGLRSNLIGIRQTGLTGKALFQRATGDMQGMDDTMSMVDRLSQTQQSLSPKYQSPTDLLKHGNLGDFIDWAGFNLGDQAGNIAQVALGGGLGGFVGRATGQMVARKLIDEAAAKALIARFAKRAAVAGAFAATTAQETGSTAQEQYQTTGDVNPGVSLTAGMVKGMLETLTPLALAGKFGFGETAGSGFLHAIEHQVTKRLGGGLAGKIAGTAVGAGTEEFTTEALQEAVDVAAHKYVDDNYKILDPAVAKRILDAGLSGAFVGMLMGGAAGPFGKSGKEALSHGGGGEPPPGPDGADHVAAAIAPLNPTPNLVSAAPVAPTVPPAVGPNIVGGAASAAAATSTPAGVVAPTAVAAEGAPVGSEGKTSLGSTVLPQLADLPKKPQDIAKATNLTVPPSAIGHLSQAITHRNVMLGHIRRNAPESVIEQSRGRAAAALAAAHKEGLAFAPTSPAPTATPTVAAVSPAPTAPTSIPIDEDGNAAPEVSPAPAASPAPVAPASPTATSVFTPAELAESAANATPAPAATTDGTTESDPLAPPVLDAHVVKEVHEAIPTHANPHVDAMLQGIRDVVGEEGGLSVLPEAMQNAFRDYSPDASNLGNIRAAIERGLERQADLKPGSAHIDMQTGMLSGEHVDGRTAEQEIPPEMLRAVTRQMLRVMKKKGLNFLAHPEMFKDERGAAIFSSRGTTAQTQNTASLSMMYMGVQLKDRSGKTRQISEMAKGSAVMSGPWNEDNKAIVRFVERVLKFAWPDGKVILELGTAKTWNNNSRALGYYAQASKDYTVISLSSKLNLTDRYITLFHELGHLIQHAQFKNLGIAGQQALWNAYAAEAQQGEITDLTIQMTSLGTHLQGNFENMKETNFLRWFDFDEWVAENVAKWFTDGGFGRGLAEQYFRKAAELFKQLYEMVFSSYQFKDFVKPSPNEAIAGWLDSLYSNASQGMPSISEVDIHSLAKESAMENLKYSNTPDLDPMTASFDDLLAASPPEQMETESINSIERAWPGNLGGASAKAQADKFTWWTKMTWGLLQIAEQNQHIAPLMNYVENVRQWSITRMQLISEANTILKAWRKLPGGKEMGQRFSDFLYAVDNMEFLPQGARKRWPNAQELSALANKYKLNAAAGQLYLQVRDHFLKVLDRMEKAWIDDAMQIQDPILQIKALNDITREMQLMRSKPYFPHARFGDYSISVRDAKGKLVSFQQFESKRAADDAIKPTQQAHPGMRVIADKMPGEMRQFNGLPPTMLQALRSRLALTPKQSETLDQYIFDMGPANSFAKKFKKRKDIAGYSFNAQRAFANYFLHAAGHIARLEFGEKLKKSVDATRASRKGMADTDIAGKSKRVDIADWMQRHYEYIMHPPHEWQALRSVAFMWYLGFAPDSAFMNLTQVPMVAAPYLSARYGNLKIIPAFLRTAMDIRKMYDDPKNSRLASDEANAFDMGVKHGFLDESQASDIAAASEQYGLAKLLPGTRTQRGITIASHWASYLFQLAEKFNRKTVFLTAYRLAKENPTAKHHAQLLQSNQELVKDLLAEGWSPENATAFLAARDAVDKSQFEYAKWARPEFMRGKKAAFFTFMMYTQNMLHFFRHQPGGYKALAIMLLFAGVQGFPFEEDVSNVINAIVKKFWKTDFNVNGEIRKLLLEVTDHPEVVMHGLGRQTMGLGMIGDALGIPIPSVDLSSRMGFGSVVPGIQALTSDNPASFEERLGGVSKDVLGATFGVGLNLLKTLASGDFTDSRTWTALLPRAFKNVGTAYRYIEQGGDTTRSGAMTTAIDVTDTKSLMEVAGQALGFVPTQIARNRELNSMQMDAFNFWTLRRAELLNHLDAAKRSKDADAFADVRNRIRIYNSTTPDPKLRISVQQMLSSLKERERQRKLIEQGKAPSKTLSGVNREVKKLFPEAGQ